MFPLSPEEEEQINGVLATIPSMQPQAGAPTPQPGMLAPQAPPMGAPTQLPGAQMFGSGGQPNALQRFLMTPGAAMMQAGLGNLAARNTGMGQITNPIQAYQSAVLEQMERQKANSGNIGNYNPGQYTTQSWAKFVQTGNPADLVRHTTDRAIKNTVQRYNPETGQYEIVSNVDETADAGATIAGAEQAATTFAQNAENFKKDKTKNLQKIDLAEQRASTVNDQIDLIRREIQEAKDTGKWDGVGLDSLTRALPGRARTVKNALDTIRANVGFQTLEEMRAASPTGGALGQITERELAFLQQVKGALDQMNTIEQLESTFNNIQNHQGESILGYKMAFDEDANTYGANDTYSGWRDRRESARQRYAEPDGTGTQGTPDPNAVPEGAPGQLPDGTQVWRHTDGTIRDAAGNLYDEDGNAV